MNIAMLFKDIFFNRKPLHLQVVFFIYENLKLLNDCDRGMDFLAASLILEPL